MSWTEIKQALLNRRTLICIGTGFSSGLPLYILISLVPAWLRTEDVGLKEIGLFALIGLPYTWKFLWSPVLDRFTLPFLGRRRGWMLCTQLALLAAIAALPLFDPRSQIFAIATLAAVIAFLSATQDIVLDAYRREILPDRELGLGNAFHINAYRLSGLVPGSLALILADHLPWLQVFIACAAFMLVAVTMTLCVAESPNTEPAPKTLKAAVTEPFGEFFSRKGVSSALTILAFMFLYKLGDSMATALATPFYIDMGFSLSEIGLVAKHAALWPMIIGSILGGIWMIQLGINRALWVFGFVQLLSILGFALLAASGPQIPLLALVIAFEYLGVGLGTAAFVAYIARNTSIAHTATQFALFTALTAVPRTVANAFSGYFVESMGWMHFFLFCTLLAIPGMLLLLKVAPWHTQDEQPRVVFATPGKEQS